MLFVLKTFISKIFRKLFQNILKIFLSCNSSVYFENIVVCILKRNVWSRYIKLTADTFSTHFCLDRCNWGTMKSLEIKIASFCELLQNRFYFKDVRRKLSSWSILKFSKVLNFESFEESFEIFDSTVSLTWRIIIIKLSLSFV